MSGIRGIVSKGVAVVLASAFAVGCLEESTGYVAGDEVCRAAEEERDPVLREQYHQSCEYYRNYDAACESLEDACGSIYLICTPVNPIGYPEEMACRRICVDDSGCTGDYRCRNRRCVIPVCG